jgi:hypothetical protein
MQKKTNDSEIEPITKVDLLYYQAEAQIQQGECEMAVVVSEAQDDIERFANFSRASGELVEIEPHQRVPKERLAERFKDPRDLFRIAFVCDMWSTGFDVPCLSTIYLNNRLRSHLGTGPRHIRAEETRADLESWIRRLLAQNIGRINFWERLESIVSRYNEANVNEAVYPSLAGGGEDIQPLDLRTARTCKLDAYADDLVALARDLAAEEQRAAREGLSEEELAIYDILTAGVKLAGDEERAQVKSLTRTLLERLQALFVLDWQSRTTTFNRVRLAITDSLHDRLPPAYSPDQRTQKSAELLLYVRERYRGGRDGAHTVA